MATKKSQQWGILIITIALVIGTLGSFAVMVLMQDEQTKLSNELAKAETKFQTLSQQQNDKLHAELNDKYFDRLSGYLPRAKAFDLNSVTKLTTKDLEKGSGDKVGDETPMVVYYIGWDANGHIFDSSFNSDRTELVEPFGVQSGLKETGVITGWKQGLKGMNLDGVRELSIPSDLAYGEQGSGDNIAPNMPLKFIVLPIAVPTPPESAEIQQALDDYMKIYEKMSS